MPPALLLPVIRSPAIRNQTTRRLFSASPHSPASILFALGALSNSRETQHFNKLTRLSRVEHSPPLKLIQTSEVDPYPLPEPPRPNIRPIGQGSPWVARRRRDWQAQHDEKALQAGRAVLADNARREARLKLALQRAQRRATRDKVAVQHERQEWQHERSKLRGDMRVAGIWILASIGTATALATWRFWPQDRGHMDSGELGRRIAQRAQSAIPLPAARSAGQRAAAASDQAAAPSAMVDAEAGIVGQLAVGSAQSSTLGAASTSAGSAKDSVRRVAAAGSEPKSNASWWKGLFWKQS